MANWYHEPPPTAGLPLSAIDFRPSTNTLEDGLSAFLGLSNVQIESSGTAAIMIALTTLKRLSKRSIVIIPAYTCPYVPLAILRCGLKPVICDTKKNHFDFCPESLKALCNDDILAIMPTHLGGRIADLDIALQTAKQCGAYVVEDAAQALGASWRGKLVGTVGDLGCYSLGVGKGLTIYGGGAVVAREASIRQTLEAVNKEKVVSKLAWETKRIFELIGYYALYRPLGLGVVFGIPLRRNLKHEKWIEAVGDNCSSNFPVHRVSRLRKSIGASALSRLPSFLNLTREQASRRKVILRKIPGVCIMDDADGDIGTWPYFLVLMPSQLSRDNALKKLWAAKLGVGRLFIHALSDYAYLPFGQVDTPNARDFAARTLTITNSPWLKEIDFMKICLELEKAIA